MNMKKAQGFTLLEVMVVIVILGILASMVVPNLMGSQERANMQKALSDVTALETSLSLYKNFLLTPLMKLLQSYQT